MQTMQVDTQSIITSYAEIADQADKYGQRIGYFLPANHSQEVIPPMGTLKLWRVIVLPQTEGYSKLRGFTITPSVLGLPLLTQSSTGVHNSQRRYGKNLGFRGNFSNTGGAVTVNYTPHIGETFLLQNNNSFPVFCVFQYETQRL